MNIENANVPSLEGNKARQTTKYYKIEPVGGGWGMGVIQTEMVVKRHLPGQQTQCIGSREKNIIIIIIMISSGNGEKCTHKYLEHFRKRPTQFNAVCMKYYYNIQRWAS